jgi:integrase
MTDHPRIEALKGIVASMSPANGAGLQAHLEYSVANEDMKPNSLYSFAVAVRNGDRLLKGKPFLEASPEEYLRVVQGFRAMYSRNSVRIRVVNLRKHVRWVYQVDNLSLKYGHAPLPYVAVERALTVAREKEQVVGQVIQPGHIRAMLESIPERNCMKRGWPIEVRDRAILAVLDAAGPRGGEHVSLRKEDVTIEGPNLAKLRFNEESAEALRALGGDGELKTGPRRDGAIYISEGVAELRAWLAVHPDSDPKAPLWVNADTAESTPFTTSSLRKLVGKAVAWAGIGASYPAALTPHDFRHTCATRKARRPYKWNEAKLNDYFGWAPGSRTAATYVHLGLDEQREQVLEDARRIAEAAPAAANPQMEALLALLRQALGQGAATAAG